MHNPFSNLVHLYQTHGYHVRPFVSSLLSHPKQIFTGSKRQKIDRTPKAITLFVGAWIIYLLVVRSVYMILGPNVLITIGCILLTTVFFPLYLIVVSYISKPYQYIQTRYIMQQARKKLATVPNLLVIGIGGSYGKTTQKEILFHMLQKHFQVLCTYENQNTPLGIARRILHHLTPAHQIFIVEMGEDHVGDIKHLCQLTQPHIGIITGITKQHMDTFGSYDCIIQTIGELFDGIQPGGTLYVHKAFEEFTPYYTKENVQIIPEATNITYIPNGGGIQFCYAGTTYTTPLLAKHTLGAIITAYLIADELGIPKEEVKKLIASIPHIKHRLEPLYNKQNNILVIDDTYNGNIEGFKSGIDILKNSAPSGTKWYITPGMIGIGQDGKSVHQGIGELLASAAEKVILIKNKNTIALAGGLMNAGCPKENIYFYSTAQEAHQALAKLLQPGDMILFQNDIPDLLL